MHYKYSLIFLVLFFYCVISYSADTTSINYFKQLKEQLLRDSTVKDIKFVKTKFWNGKIHTQKMFVQYKNDSTNRYWLVGRDFFYYKSGLLSMFGQTNINTQTLQDTIFKYSKDGELFAIQVFDSANTQPIPIKLIFNFKSIFSRYYEKCPRSYKRIYYEDKHKKAESSFKYFDGINFKLHGTVLFYNKDGTIEKTIKFNRGVEIKTP